MRNILNRVYYRKLKHSSIFTSYSDIFSHIVAYLEPCVALAYLEPCHIQNPGICRTRDIFRTLSRHILEHSERCVTSHIENPAILKILVCLGPEAQNPVYLHIFRHNSGIFCNNSYDNINFLFFHFSTKLNKDMFFGYNEVNFSTRLSLFK